MIRHKVLIRRICTTPDPASVARWSWLQTSHNHGYCHGVALVVMGPTLNRANLIITRSLFVVCPPPPVTYPLMFFFRAPKHPASHTCLSRIFFVIVASVAADTATIVRTCSARAQSNI